MENSLDILKILLGKNRVIPVIGAGVSYAVAKLPGWKAAIENGLVFAETLHLDSDLIVEARKQLDRGNLTESADLMKKLLGAPTHLFSSWLENTFGNPKISSPDLLNSIENLGAPILLTTNYDRIFSSHRSVRTREVFDWTDYEEVVGALSRDPRFILHLHGIWNKPETVILSKEDYTNLANELGYKELLKKLWTDYHFLFIGCSGNGVMDEDFSTIFGFLNEWFPCRTHQHFILLNQRDIAAKMHIPLLKQCNVIPISYGYEYSELAGFIRELSPNTTPAAQEPEKPKQEITTKRIFPLHGKNNKSSSLPSSLFRWPKNWILATVGCGLSAFIILLIIQSKTGKLNRSEQLIEDLRIETMLLAGRWEKFDEGPSITELTIVLNNAKKFYDQYPIGDENVGIGHVIDKEQYRANLAVIASDACFRLAILSTDRDRKSYLAQSNDWNSKGLENINSGLIYYDKLKSSQLESTSKKNQRYWRQGNDYNDLARLQILRVMIYSIDYFAKRFVGSEPLKQPQIIQALFNEIDEKSILALDSQRERLFYVKNIFSNSTPEFIE